MSRKDIDDTGLSELERELELEMGDERESVDDREWEKELESAIDSDRERPEEEADKGDTESTDYADRFYELSQRSFESEFEMDDSVNRLLTEMEREYFFRGLWRRMRQGGRWLLRRAAGLARGTPIGRIVSGVTQLARGNLRGALGSLARAGLGSLVSAIPGGAAALPALNALGLGETDDPERNREGWNNYVSVVREAYDNLARNLNERANDPIEANRLATEAFRAGMRSAQNNRPQTTSRGRRVISLRSGERVIIKAV